MKKKKIFISIIFCLLINLGMCINIEAASNIKLNKSNITIQVGKTYNLKVKGTKEKAKWKTANKKVATVNSKGKVTGKKVGITATVGKKILKCKVTVKAKGLDFPKTGKTILKEYIMKYGSTNSDGEKFIKEKSTGDAGVYNWAIVYEDSIDSFLFLMIADYYDGDRSSLSMTVPIEDVTFLTCEFVYVFSERPLSFSATGTINIKTFNKNTNVNFTVEDSADYSLSLKNEIRSLSNEMLQITISSWNIVLDKVGITMKDIGFLSYL